MMHHAATCGPFRGRDFCKITENFVFLLKVNSPRDLEGLFPLKKTDFGPALIGSSLSYAFKLRHCF